MEPMLTTSVIVDRMMLDAVAGSAPSFLSTTGTEAPDSPLTRTDRIVAMSSSSGLVGGIR